MAAIHGKNAEIKKDATTVFGGQDWSIDFSGDVVDISDMGDEWKSKLAGLADWSGSFNCLFDLTDAPQRAIHDALVAASPSPELTDAKFYVDDTHYYSGTILVTGVKVEAKLDDVVRLSITFEGSGAPTPPTYT